MRSYLDRRTAPSHNANKNPPAYVTLEEAREHLQRIEGRLHAARRSTRFNRSEVIELTILHKAWLEQIERMMARVS